MTGKTGAQGPLTGIIVVEIAGIGPGPHAAMLLADMGATVVRVDRLGGNGWPNPVVDRGRSVHELDLRSPAGKERCLDLIGFVAGLVAGLAVYYGAADAPWVDTVSTYVTGQVSQIFLRLLFMLVIPLLVSALIVGVAEMGEMRALKTVGLRDRKRVV